MLGIEIDKNYYSQSLGISCVEKSVLGFLEYIKYPYQILFIDSYINLESVFTDFLETNVPYMKFTGLKRLQQVSEELGILKTEYMETNFDKMVQCSCIELTERRPLLVRVKPNKLPNAKFMPWAEEHFILLYKIDNEFFLLNQYPLSEYVMTLDEIRDIYDGAILRIVPIFNVDLKQYKQMAQKTIEKIAKQKEYNFIYEITDDNVEHLRNAVGVLKLSRLQIKEWLVWLKSNFDEINYHIEVIPYLEELVSIFNKLYLAIEYYRYRKNNLLYIKELINTVVRMENSLKNYFE